MIRFFVTVKPFHRSRLSKRQKVIFHNRSVVARKTRAAVNELRAIGLEPRLVKKNG